MPCGLRRRVLVLEAGDPSRALVVLTGARTVGHEAPSFAFRLPAPAGTDAAAMWRWAARHQGAEELPEPPEDPR